MRLLIVDDSALMRTLLTECFATDPDIEVTTARDGEDALTKFAQLRPDIVTLDINMPRMDGLTCLAHMMEIERVPVIMVSSLTTRGALASFEALELGATDFVAKPGGTVSHNIREVFAELRAKVRSAGRKRRPARRQAPPEPQERRAPARSAGQTEARPELVLIGVSTGGPAILGDILGALPASFPVPILIAQHMPPRFTGVFADRLNSTCALQVSELTKPCPLLPGQVHVISGGGDAEVTMRFRRLAATPVAIDDSYSWRPSVSRMVASALATLPATKLIGVQLTGMGDDGAREFARLHAEGGLTIAESEDSAAVFGMPMKLIDYGGATEILPSGQIAEQLIAWTSRVRVKRTA